MNSVEIFRCYLCKNLANMRTGDYYVCSTCLSQTPAQIDRRIRKKKEPKMCHICGVCKLTGKYKEGTTCRKCSGVTYNETKKAYFKKWYNDEENRKKQIKTTTENNRKKREVLVDEISEGT